MGFINLPVKKEASCTPFYCMPQKHENGRGIVVGESCSSLLKGGEEVKSVERGENQCSFIAEGSYTIEVKPQIEAEFSKEGLCMTVRFDA